MPKIDKSGNFEQLYIKLCEKDPFLESEIQKRIRWFKKNPKDTRLDVHDLTGKMTGQCAFSITGDIRIIYKWTNKNTVHFLAIGSHIKVYSRRVNKIFKTLCPIVDNLIFCGILITVMNISSNNYWFHFYPLNGRLLL